MLASPHGTNFNGLVGIEPPPVSPFYVTRNQNTLRRRGIGQSDGNDAMEEKSSVINNIGTTWQYRATSPVVIKDTRGQGSLLTMATTGHVRGEVSDNKSIGHRWSRQRTDQSMRGCG